MEALVTLETTKNPPNLAVVVVRRSLAGVRLEQGRNSEAESVLRECLAERKKSSFYSRVSATQRQHRGEYGSR